MMHNRQYKLIIGFYVHVGKSEKMQEMAIFSLRFENWGLVYAE